MDSSHFSHRNNEENLNIINSKTSNSQIESSEATGIQNNIKINSLCQESSTESSDNFEVHKNEENPLNKEDKFINNQENDTSLDKRENDTSLDKRENDTSLDKRENDTSLNKHSDILENHIIEEKNLIQEVSNSTNTSTQINIFPPSSEIHKDISSDGNDNALTLNFSFNLPRNDLTESSEHDAIARRLEAGLILKKLMTESAPINFPLLNTLHSQKGISTFHNNDNTQSQPIEKEMESKNEDKKTMEITPSEALLFTNKIKDDIINTVIDDALKEINDKEIGLDRLGSSQNKNESFNKESKIENSALINKSESNESINNEVNKEESNIVNEVHPTPTSVNKQESNAPVNEEEARNIENGNFIILRIIPIETHPTSVWSYISSKIWKKTEEANEIKEKPMLSNGFEEEGEIISPSLSEDNIRLDKLASLWKVTNTAKKLPSSIYGAVSSYMSNNTQSINSDEVHTDVNTNSNTSWYGSVINRLYLQRKEEKKIYSESIVSENSSYIKNEEKKTEVLSEIPSSVPSIESNNVKKDESLNSNESAEIKEPSSSVTNISNNESSSVPPSSSSSFWQNWRATYDFMLCNLKLKYDEKLRDLDDRIKFRVWAILENKIDDLLEESMRPWMHETFVDRNMPIGMSKIISKSIDVLWPDFREEFWEIYYTGKAKKHPKYQQQLLDRAELEVTKSLIVEEKMKNQKVSLSKKWLCSRIFYRILHFRLLPDPYPNLRAFILYHINPYSLTFWDRVKDFWWYLFKSIRMFPWYGVSSWSFLILWFLIDRTDEFQLVQFILDVKGAQFVTVGVISAFLAMISYWKCVNWTGDPLHSCAIEGPGSQSLYYFGLMGFIIDLILAWYAFTCLPFSKKKGEFHFEHIDRAHGREYKKYDNLSINPVEHEADIQDGWMLIEKDNEDEFMSVPEYESNQRLTLWERIFRNVNSGRLKESMHYFARRGGQLPYLLQYDLIVFTLVLVISIALLLFRPYNIFSGDFFSKEWMFKTDLFFLKTLFGLLSFPFAIFITPLGSFLTHIRKTGYNKRGECVPAMRQKGHWGFG